MCGPGTYQNSSGADTCLNCPPGLISSKMKDHCTPCPQNTWSDGVGEICQSCSTSECRCLQKPFPCFKGVQCYNPKPDGASYVCGSCPPGMNGAGISCSDIDEVFDTG